MAVFIVCEFDPFHYGHEYLISEARRLFPGHTVVCVMSGNFVQRGNPALYDEYARARCAIEGGADIVLSLPFPWCTASAERFASGAASVADGLWREGDALLFGSECGDAERLASAASVLSSPEFDRLLGERIRKTREPYAKARQALFADAELLSSRNDVLGIEYVKALRKLRPGAVFVPVKRTDHESSTAIRESGDIFPHLPTYCRNILRSVGDPSDIRFAGHALLSHLREEPYRLAADGENGLTGRLSRAAEGAGNITEALSAAASPQFTNARIRRAALYSYLKVSKRELCARPLFTQLFAANGAGISYLSKTKKTRSIAVITKPSHTSSLTQAAMSQYELQRRADRLYCLCFARAREASYFMKTSPYIKKGGSSGE